jgi:hypothetical protein
VPSVTLREWAIEIAWCPTCEVREGTPCRTPTGRNHPERIVVAMTVELDALGGRKLGTTYEDVKRGRAVAARRRSSG